MIFSINYVLLAACYTAVYNLVGCPAGILPVTTETSLDQAGLANYPTDDTAYRMAKHASLGAEGCPLGIQVGLHMYVMSDFTYVLQVVGRHYQEEMVLHVMKTIEDLVNKK